jgi:hypothetical protein
VNTNTSRIRAIIGIVGWLAFSYPAFAQQRLELQFGVRVGIPFTDSFTSDTPVISVRETVDRVPASVGPTFEAILYDRVLVQFDAVYKPFRGHQQSLIPPTGGSVDSRAAWFEFPVIADYLFSKRNTRPYAGLGIMAAQIGQGTIEDHFAPGVSTVPFEAQLFLRNQLPAYLANGGLEWSTQHLVLRPEIRYTRWNKRNGFQAVQNQLELSIGLSLRGKR